MSSEWPVINLNELCLKITDGAHQSPKSVSVGKPMASVKDLTRFGVDLSNARLISKEDFDLLVRQGCRPEVGDVLIAKDGNSALDTVCAVGRKLDVVLLSSVAILRPNPAKIYPSFLRHYLASPNVVRYLKDNFISGAAIPRVVLKDFKKAEILVPPIETQRIISSILDALDEKISLLYQTNVTLEAIAQALFKSWFVDFEPVRAKAEGLNPDGMDAATAALFPDGFEKSELGLVPLGWKTGCVADIAVQKKGSVNPLASPNEWFEHYSLPAFDSGKLPVLEYGKLIKSNKTPLPEEAVLLSKLNPHIPRVWLPVKSGENAVCSTEFLAYSPKTAGGKELIYCLFSSAEFQRQLCQLVTGTSNSHQRVKPDQILKLQLAIADDALQIAFADITSPIFERIYANRLKAQTLTQIRDTLLPRLISGDLRLSEAVAEVEEDCA